MASPAWTAVRRLALTTTLAVGLLGVVSPPAEAAPRWVPMFADDFDIPVPLGSFSDCNHYADTPRAYCGGLSGSVRDNWWAYPNTWPDTAKQRGYPVGGTYHPEDTVSVSPDVSGDGQMHLRMWRPANGGDVHSATVVPKKLMEQTYGAYEETWRVSKAAPGYKSAHLLWPVDNDGCSEIDFPELEWNTTVAGFAHPSDCGEQDAFDTNAKWTDWHTSRIEWTPGRIRFYLDGKLVGESTRGVPDRPMNWDIQNESALNGDQAAPGSWAQMDITSVRGWAWK
ncbi:hypothetical protein ADL21_11235 [Streptomyces albus subsp. albus]|nr:hypothetical protein ADL21_11235 [Streptomyces albus subsp. albus]